MTESDIAARLEALKRLRVVIQEGEERLAHSATVDPQEYFYRSMVAAANRAMQERYEAE